MNHSAVNRVTISRPNFPYIPQNYSLQLRLARAIDILDKNNFPGLNFSVHHETDNKPTIVLTGTYESQRDKDLFITLLNSKEFKNILPENVVVEWMHGDEEFPNKTFLETHPHY